MVCVFNDVVGVTECGVGCDDVCVNYNGVGVTECGVGVTECGVYCIGVSVTDGFFMLNEVRAKVISRHHCHLFHSSFHCSQKLYTLFHHLY